MPDGAGARRPHDLADSDRDGIEVVIDGQARLARPGETVLTALLAYGHSALSKDLAGRISGAYCGMGVCFACNVVVDGVKRRACATAVQEGMSIRTCLSLADVLAECRKNAKSGRPHGSV